MNSPTDAPSADANPLMRITSRRSVRSYRLRHRMKLFADFATAGRAVRDQYPALAGIHADRQPPEAVERCHPGGTTIPDRQDAYEGIRTTPRMGLPHIERRRKIGWDLYGLLGITREDKDKMRHQHGRNYFFDAPVGVIFSIDRVPSSSWLDYGCPRTSWWQRAGAGSTPVRRLHSIPSIVSFENVAYAGQ